MAIVQALCRRGIVQDGKVVLDAPVEDAAAFYLRMLDQASTSAIGERTDRRGYRRVVVDRIDIAGDDQAASSRPAVARGSSSTQALQTIGSRAASPSSISSATP